MTQNLRQLGRPELARSTSAVTQSAETNPWALVGWLVGNHGLGAVKGEG